MKRSLLLIAVLGTLATPVSADSSQGPGAPMPLGGAQDAIVLSADTTQAEIDAQVRANIAAGRASYAEIARAGGCKADFLPAAIAAYCWAQMMNGWPASANPTGGPIGASSGGSDGGSAD